MEVHAGRDGTKLLYSGTLDKGQRKTFHGGSLRVVLLQPDNVSVRLGGRSVDLPVGTEFVVTSKRIVRAPS